MRKQSNGDGQSDKLHLKRDPLSDSTEGERGEGT